MASVVETLVDMGFLKERAELAVSKTGSQDVQTLIDWMLSHEDELDAPEILPEPNPLEAGTTDGPTEINETVASETVESSESAAPKSIKCDDCGKLFKNNDEVEYHAVKSGHGNFSESTEEKKVLTEEEKKEQLAKIEAKLKQRRLEREAREKEEALLREKARIKSGKELLEAKKKFEELEMKKIIEARKKEKEDERLAKQRVREQIEADKLARKAKFSGAQPPETTTSVCVAPATSGSVEKQQPQQQKTYTEVKLQIRLIDGKILTQDFGIKEPLSAVRLYVEMNRTDGDGPFKLMTSFPRKVFSPEDYDKPLESLGLAPAATLFVGKS